MLAKRVRGATLEVATSKDQCPPIPRAGIVHDGKKSEMEFNEMAWGFIETYEELNTRELNELLEKNVPLEALVFFEQYAELVRSQEPGLKSHDAGRLPEIMLMGYLLHALEDRLQPKTLPAA